MIQYLLQEIEKSPHALFTKKELAALSQEDFEYLTGKKVLTYFRPSENDMEKVGSFRCQHGCPLTLVTVEGGLEAVCLDHPEEDPVPVEEDDLYRYAFSIESLLANIRIANQLKGELHSIERYWFYVGYKTYNARRTGFVFTSQINREHLITSLGLKRLCEEDDTLIILTPFSKIEDVALKRSMHHHSIMQISLADCLDFQSFELSEKNLKELVKKIEGDKPYPIEFDLNQFNESKKTEYDFKQEMTTLAKKGYIKYSSHKEATKAVRRIRERLKNSKYASIKLKQEKDTLRLDNGIQIIIQK